MVRTTRIKTYSPGDIVSATDLNAIQDHIADTAHVVNRLATMSNAASVWVDRTGDEGSATVYPVVDQGFVKMQAGGQRGRLMLPGVGWRTITLTGPAVEPDARTTLWVLVENRHEPLNEWLDPEFGARGVGVVYRRVSNEFHQPGGMRGGAVARNVAKSSASSPHA